MILKNFSHIKNGQSRIKLQQGARSGVTIFLNESIYDIIKNLVLLLILNNKVLEENGRKNQHFSVH